MLVRDRATYDRVRSNGRLGKRSLTELSRARCHEDYYRGLRLPSWAAKWQRRRRGLRETSSRRSRFPFKAFGTGEGTRTPDRRFWRTIGLVPLSPFTNHSVSFRICVIGLCTVLLRPAPPAFANLGSKMAAEPALDFGLQHPRGRRCRQGSLHPHLAARRASARAPHHASRAFTRAPKEPAHTPGGGKQRPREEDIADWWTLFVLDGRLRRTASRDVWCGEANDTKGGATWNAHALSAARAAAAQGGKRRDRLDAGLFRYTAWSRTPGTTIRESLPRGS